MLMRVAATIAKTFPTSVQATLVHPYCPDAISRADAPAGGCVMPPLTMAATANAPAKLCRTGKRAPDAAARDTAMATSMETVWPIKALRGCEAGAAVRPYKRVTNAPNGLTRVGTDVSFGMK